MPQTHPSVLLLDYALKMALGIACDFTKAETLESLALAYAAAGQPARAATILRRVWQMVRGMPGPSDKTSELRWLAEACVEANLEDLALAVAADLVQASERADVYVDLAQHYARAGRIQPATARLSQALELARAAAQAGEDASFTLREIAETAVDLGLTEHAVQVASALDRDWVAVQALCAVAVRCALTWQHAPVAAIFDRALKRIAALASPDDWAHLLADLVKGRVQAGLLDHTPVLRVTEAIEHPAARADAWLAIAAGYADLGERDRVLAAVDHACATARTMQADEAGAKVLAAAADLYGQGGARERVAEAIPEGADKTSALDDIATAYIDGGHYQEALHTVQRIENADSRAWALVWALIRISHQRREGSPRDSLQPSIPVLLQLIAPRHPR